MQRCVDFSRLDTALHQRHVTETSFLVLEEFIVNHNVKGRQHVCIIEVKN